MKDREDKHGILICHTDRRKMGDIWKTYPAFMYRGKNTRIDKNWFLFFDFVYEVIREKMILGIDGLSDADIRIFFKEKQAQSEKVAALQDCTLKRLGSCYKTQLMEAGMLDDQRTGKTRKIWMIYIWKV